MYLFGHYMNKLLFLSTLIVFPLTLSNTYSFGLPQIKYNKIEEINHINGNSNILSYDVKYCADAFFKGIFGVESVSLFQDLTKKYDNSDRFKKNVGNAIEDNFGKFSIILRSGNIDLLASIDYIADKYWSKNHRLLLFLAICFETCALELACACRDTVIVQGLANKPEYKNNKLRMQIINWNIVQLTEFIRNKAKKIIGILERDKFKDRRFKKELDPLKEILFAQQNIRTDEYIKNRIKRIILYSDAYKAYSDRYSCEIHGCDTAKAMYGQMLLHDCYKLILRFINTTGHHSGDSLIQEYQSIAMLRTFLVDAVKKQCFEISDESIKGLIDTNDLKL